MNRFKNMALAVVLSTIVAAAAIAAWSFLPAFAQGGSNALSVLPRKDYTVEPGKTVNDTLVIRNLDRNEPLHLTLRVIDFTYQDQTGTAKLLLDENEPQTTWSLKPFLNIPEQVTVEPGESMTVDLSVSIPEGHGAGSYYSAILYSSGIGEEGNVGLSASSTTLVFTTIPGDVNEKLELEKFGAYNPASGKYSFFTGVKPKQVAYTLKNEGNVTQAPEGTITIKHWPFGKEQTINEINPNKSLALIGQTRTYEACIKLNREEVDFEGTRSEAVRCAEPSLLPGLYQMNLAAYYGQNGNITQELFGKGSFWYLPWWFLLIVIAVVVFVGYHGWRLYSYVQLNRQKSGKTKRSRR